MILYYYYIMNLFYFDLVSFEDCYEFFLLLLNHYQYSEQKASDFILYCKENYRKICLDKDSGEFIAVVDKNDKLQVSKKIKLEY